MWRSTFRIVRVSADSPSIRCFMVRLRYVTPDVRLPALKNLFWGAHLVMPEGEHRLVAIRRASRRMQAIVARHCSDCAGLQRRVPNRGSRNCALEVFASRKAGAQNIPRLAIQNFCNGWAIAVPPGGWKRGTGFQE